MIVLANINIINFVDDFLVPSKDIQSHLKDLENLFHEFKKNNITISFKKCEFFRDTIEFVGHEITTKGIKKQRKKIDLIESYPAPRNKRELKRFLGVINFYSKFTDKYANVTEPLYVLLRDNIKWEWSDRQMQVFEQIKILFLEEVILNYTDVNKEYILRSDASKKCISSIISQIDENGHERMISCASRILRKNELNYTTSEKELLAIVWGLFKFEIYLRGSRVKVLTDHQALIFALTTRFTNERLNRWIMAIQSFDLEIKHIKGKENIVADLFSRYPDEYTNARLKPDEIIIAGIKKLEISKELRNIFKNLERYQEDQLNIKDIKDKILEKEECEERRVDCKIKNCKLCKYAVKNNLVCKISSDKNYRIVVPDIYVDRLIREIHNVYGHIGSQKVVKLVEEAFYISNLRHKVTKNLARCESCQVNKNWNRSCQAPMKNIIVDKPSKLLSVDFYGNLPTSTGGVKYIFVTIDAFSKFVKLYPIKKANTNIVLYKLLNDYFPKYRKPEEIICDHGSQFTSSKWIETLEKEGIKIHFSAVRHPQSNIVERVNKELGNFFRTFVNNKHTGWFDYVNLIETIINETYHDSIGCTPLELHLNKKPTRIWEKYLNFGKIELINYETKIMLAKDRIQKRAKKRKNKNDEKKKNLFITFKENDLVYLKANNVSNLEKKVIDKFFSIYIGPFRVKKIVYDYTYILVDPITNIEKGLYNINDLKPYKKDTLE